VFERQVNNFKIQGYRMSDEILKSCFDVVTY